MASTEHKEHVGFTPGPWYFHTDRFSGLDLIEVIDCNDCAIAYQVTGETLEQRDANALLIADAPNLYTQLLAMTAQRDQWEALFKKDHHEQYLSIVADRSLINEAIAQRDIGVSMAYWLSERACGWFVNEYRSDRTATIAAAKDYAIAEHNARHPEAKQVMATIESDLLEAKAEVAACIGFMRSQLDWENWWADGWLNKDAAAVSQARQNANALREFLADKGHGISLLKHFDQKEAEITAQRDRWRKIAEDALTAYETGGPLECENIVKAMAEEVAQWEKGGER